MNINDFINLCTSINSRSYLNKNQYAIPPQTLRELQSKYEDKNLYLGIVGEFDSGKSTLINAILQQNLLKENIIQGTTCVPTFIQYNSSFDVVVKYKNGKEISFAKENPGELKTLDLESGAIRSFIDKFTAEEQFASELDRVTVYLNNPILQNNIVIVDTPGINASNQQHSEVTKQTLDKYCDAAVVLTPANAACSETTCNFLKENIAGLEDRCLAIISKIDYIQASEEDKLVSYVKQRLNSLLDKPLAAVLPVSAIYSQGQNENEAPITPEQEKRYIQYFNDFKTTIDQRLQQGREAILAQSMSKSVLKTLSTLQNKLKLIKDNLQVRKQNLESNQLTDIDKFLNKLLPSYKEDFNSFKNTFDFDDVKIVLKSAKHRAKRKLKNDVNNFTSIATVKSKAKKKFRKRCKKARKKVVKKLKSIRAEFIDFGNDIYNNFVSEFDKEFQQLNLDIQSDEIRIDSISSLSSNSLRLNISLQNISTPPDDGSLLGNIRRGINQLFNNIAGCFSNTDDNNSTISQADRMNIDRKSVV